MTEKENARREAATGQGRKGNENFSKPDDSSWGEESQALTLTFWQDIAGRDKKDVQLLWPKFVKRLENVKPAQSKIDSSLIKFARFGDTRTDAGSLRHDSNVIEVTGIEGDLDNGNLSFDQARELIERHNIKAVICTTFSHTPETPRLRVFAPLSTPCPPEDRRRYTARLNGILAGNLGEESFRLSQSFFIGGKPGSEYRVEHTFDDPGDGYYIDEQDALDEIAIDPGERSGSASSSEHLYNKDNTYEQGFSRGGGTVGGDNKSQQKTTFDNISFEKGGRDNAIFHLANYLVKGGMPHENIRKYLKFVASHCKPAFPEKEIPKKISSAMQRSKNQERNLTQEIKEWILTTNASFLTTDIYNCQHLTTRDEKKKANAILSRFARNGFIERTGRRAGEYRLVDTEAEVIDFLNAPTTTVPLWMPFQLGEMADTMPGNIILIAGEPNAGKTAFLLNVVRQNMGRFDMHYFSSEMGASELRKRLSNRSFRDERQKKPHNTVWRAFTPIRAVRPHRRQPDDRTRIGLRPGSYWASPFAG